MAGRRSLWRGWLLATIGMAVLAFGPGGCGSGSPSNPAAGEGPVRSGGFNWGTSRVVDPTRMVQVRDADGTLVWAAPGQLLVTFGDTIDEQEVEAFVARVEEEGGEVVGAVPGSSMLEIQFDEDADLADLQQRLAAAPGVVVVCLNEVAEAGDPSEETRGRAQPTPMPGAYAGDYWMTQVRLREAWQRLSAADAWPAVGVVDGGPGSFARMMNTSRATVLDSVGRPMTLTTAASDTHLSRVTALIGADGTTNTWGLAFGSRMFVYDVESPEVSPSTGIASATATYYARIVWAFDQALQNRCRVINMSMGPPTVTVSMSDAEFYPTMQHFRRNLVGSVAQAVRKDALICIASGNEAKKHDDRLLPGNEPTAGFSSNVLFVSSNAAGNPAGTQAEFPAVVADANEGTVVNITAPGEDVSPGPEWPAESGTSYSSPLVAGAAAVVMQAAPRLKASEVRQILLDTANPNVRSGSGLRLLDVDAAVARARAIAR